MERRTQEVLHSNEFEICRVCRRSKPTDDGYSRPVCAYVDILNHKLRGLSLKELLLSCLNVDVKKDDEKPKILCSKCLRLVDRWYDTKLICDESQRIIDRIAKKKLKQLTEPKLEISNEVECNINQYSGSNEGTSDLFNSEDMDVGIISNEEKFGHRLTRYPQTSTEICEDVHNELNNRNKLKRRPCPKAIPIDYNDLVQVTEVDMENYNGVIRNLNMSSVSNMTRSDVFNNAAIDVVIHNKHDTISNEKKYGHRLRGNSQTSTEGCMDLPIELNKSRNILMQRRCPKAISIDYNELKHLTEPKIKISDQVKYNINENSGSNEATSDSFNGEDMDCIIYNTNGIISNEEKYGHHLTGYSQTSTEGCIDLPNELNKSRNILMQRPCPKAIPIDNNELIEIDYSSVETEKVDEKIKYDEILYPGFNMQASELFNGTNSAVSNSKKRSYVKKTKNKNLQIVPKVPKVDSKLNTSPFKLLNHLTDRFVGNTIITRNNKRKCKQNISMSEMSLDGISDEIIDANEPRYCVCDQVAFGTMVACDNKTCITEWYHFGCVGITKTPRGKWYCPKCKNTAIKLKTPKQKPRKTLKKK